MTRNYHWSLLELILLHYWLLNLHFLQSNVNWQINDGLALDVTKDNATTLSLLLQDLNYLTGFPSTHEAYCRKGLSSTRKKPFRQSTNSLEWDRGESEIPCVGPKSWYQLLIQEVFRWFSCTILGWYQAMRLILWLKNLKQILKN